MTRQEIISRIVSLRNQVNKLSMVVAEEFGRESTHWLKQASIALDEQAAELAEDFGLELDLDLDFEPSEEDL